MRDWLTVQVHITWLLDSEKYNEWMNPQDYALSEPEPEPEPQEAPSENTGETTAHEDAIMAESDAE